MVDTITNVGVAALLAKGAKKMYDNSKKTTDVKAPDFAGGPSKGKDPRGTGKTAPAPATAKKESAPTTKKAPATAKKESAPAPKKAPAPAPKKAPAPAPKKAPAPAPKPSAPAPKPSAPAPSAKPSIWAKFRQATKAGSGAASAAAGSGVGPRASKEIGQNTVGTAVRKGGRIALEAVKRNPRMALAAGAAALAYGGYKYLKNRNANKQEQPATVSMTKTKETQSNQPMNSSMTETTKTQSNAEANKPVSRSESKYPTYQKDSEEAKDFRSNFAKARKEQGKDGTFEWQGRKYNTKLKGE